ncbi:hypothetical protein ACFFTN_01365 [Aminobacter aganoensis]|uniref:DNA-binding IclR family transcriptional regulator n=1 Tax=Aminobacter aganoensis TaxID=83264 RepID=A0A7X0F5J1_9HYPH|nr:hypothetical protein [Aminobacter aganoensis]MBB6353492.1 DNA-binding IclR family transcriptional regulator [Aminobacter aganoensis]
MFTAVAIFSVTWKPRPDISTYELALCMPIIAAMPAYDGGSIRVMYDRLPAEAQRHFEMPGQVQADTPGTAQASSSIWDSLKSVASA